MVHLPYCNPRVTLEQMQLIWNHLTLHLGFSAYIAYIDHKPTIQHLAESVGFTHHGEYWQYGTNT